MRGRDGRRTGRRPRGGLLAAVLLLAVPLGACGGGEQGEPPDRGGGGGADTPWGLELSGADPGPATTGVPSDEEFTLGEERPVGQVSLASGGTLTGDPAVLDGFRVDVPAEAYADGTVLTATAAPVLTHGYGPLVTPLSPLLTVSGAEGMAGAPMTVHVPVTVPEGWFAMGFFRDPATGLLEGMPIIEVLPDAVVVATAHFSSFFVAGVDVDLLPEEVATGFDPALDTFRFGNPATYLQPDGMCAGMSLAEMWYFVEQVKAGRTLDHVADHYDGVHGTGPSPGFWIDDAHGIRFAATVHEDARWASSAWKFFREARYTEWDWPAFQAFRFSMAVTGEPQYVTMGTAGNVSGHAMVAYGVAGDDLLIADPNFPGVGQTITYDAQAEMFQPYGTSLVGAGPSYEFPYIGYLAKTALVDWAGIGRRFAEAEAGTVGNDRFPYVDLQAIELVDGMESHETVGDGYTTTRTPLPVYGVVLGSTMNVLTTFYRNGEKVASADMTSSPETTIGSGTPAMLPLAPGANHFGVRLAIFMEDAETPTSGYVSAKYVDYVPLTITLGEAPVTVPVPEDTVAPEPDTTAFDCSQCTGDTSITNLNCKLHCEQISPGPGSWAGASAVRPLAGIRPPCTIW